MALLSPLFQQPCNTDCWPVRRDVGRRGCLCLWLKCMAVFMCVFMIFITKKTLDFGLWDASLYISYKGCSELIYNLDYTSSEKRLGKRKAPSVDLALPFTGSVDQDIMETCGIQNPDPNTSNYQRNIYNHYMNGTNKYPVVFTKCSRVKPTLLSAKYVSRTSERFDAVNNLVVPNVVHRVSYGSWDFKFLNYLSFISVDRYLKPKYIFLHGQGTPKGPWWNKTLQEVPNIYQVPRERPLRVHGKNVKYIEHASDIIRLQTLYDNGGIYLDFDILVFKSFEPLRRYDMTLGRETSDGLNNGIIVSRPLAPFVCVWLHSYRDYSPWPWSWAIYSIKRPNILAKKIPEYVHIEESSLQKPSWTQAEKLFTEVVGWKHNYAIHVWKSYGRVPQTPDEIKYLDTTLGEMMRVIYFGKKDLIYDKP